MQLFIRIRDNRATNYYPWPRPRVRKSLKRSARPDLAPNLAQLYRPSNFTPF
jgi:hypothetical protein